MSDFKFTKHSASFTLTEETVREFEEKTGYTVEQHLEAANSLMSHIAFPEGRKAAWERIDRMCSVHSIASQGGTIDRSSSPLWKTSSYKDS